MLDWFDERVIAPIAGLVAAVIIGWRVAKRVKINGKDNNGGGSDDGSKVRTELLCSIDSSLKVLVDGQKQAVEKLDRMADDVSETRRELAQLWGSIMGRRP